MKGLMIAASFLALFIIVPLLTTIASFDPKSFEEMLNNQYLRNQFIEALNTTLIASFLSVIILTLLGVPLAYLIARKSFCCKKMIESLLDLPMMIPHSVVGIMILLSYSSSPVGHLLRRFGVDIVDSILGTIVVMMFVGAPFLINSAKKGFESIPRSAELVARSLGADETTTFLRISLPMARRHIITGAILAWARGVSEVGALLIVAYNPLTLSVLVYDWYTTLGLKLSLVVAIFMLFLSILTFLLFRRFEGEHYDRDL